MAFKMKPGRGNMAKTGAGVPPTLMCGSPIKQTDPKKPVHSTEIELTDKFNTGKAKITNAAKVAGKVADLKATQGINVDAATGKATANPYEKRFLKGNENVSAKVLDTFGKATQVASKHKGINSGNEKLYNEFKKDSTNTMSMRNYNAMQYNITGGTKSTNNATEAEKKILVNTGKAKKIK